MLRSSILKYLSYALQLSCQCDIVVCIDKPRFLRTISTPNLFFEHPKEFHSPPESVHPQNHVVHDQSALHMIRFRIDETDSVVEWDDNSYYNSDPRPNIGENIIYFWEKHSLDHIIAVYKNVKLNKSAQRLIRQNEEDHYMWCLIPDQKNDLHYIRGYIINIEFLYSSLLSAEQRYEDSQMIQSALNSHQTRYQCYNILSCLHSMQAVVPLLQKTRHQDLLDHEGKLLNHYELCEELMHEVENAHDFTEVLLKRQQQCEDVIACQQDTITLELKPFDVVHMIKYLWKHNHAKAKKKNLDFILDIEPLSAHRLPIIFQDEFRLRQVIQTFIDNSIAYTSEGAIHLYLGLDTDSIKIHVIDSGCGIDEQVLQASVDKLRIGHLSFSQPKPSAGLGISLSIAQHIINKMGGKLYIYSSDATAVSMSSVSSVAESFSGTTQTQTQSRQADNNVGTKMEIILPCKHHTIEPFHGDDPNICEHDSISNTAESYKKDTIRSKFRMNKRDIILIVDDDDLILRFLSKMLQKWKYEHRTCSNGIDASRLYETLHSRISLIIMDIQMPIDGITTTKAIRRFETKMNIPFKVPIVANTASGSTDSLRKTCTEAGMCGFTQKPNHKTDIKQIIERYATFH